MRCILVRCCSFCGKPIPKDEDVKKWWVVDRGLFVDICLGCEERIKIL